MRPFFILIAGLMILAALPVRAAPVAAERALEATFVLFAAEGAQGFLGSGFAFGRPGLVFTNAHVVGERARVVAESRDGTRQGARVLWRDGLRDIAILAVAEAGTPVLKPAPQPPDIGQPVLAAGAPLGQAFSLSAGVVSALGRQTDPAVPMRYLQHDAAVNPGSSGGPLVDGQGRLLGMNTQIADGSRHFVGLAYAIPVAALTAALARMRAGVQPAEPRLGLRLRAVTPAIAEALGPGAAEGVLVDDAEAGGLAARAGVRAGDILTHLGARAVTRPGDVAFALEALPVRGAGRTLTVRRHGAERRLALPDADLPRSPVQPSPARGRFTLSDLGLTLGPAGRIAAVDPDGPARKMGLQAGERIEAVNGRQTDDMQEGWQTEPRFGAPVLLRVAGERGRRRHVLLGPEAGGRLRPLGSANVVDPDVVLF